MPDKQWAQVRGKEEEEEPRFTMMNWHPADCINTSILDKENLELALDMLVDIKVVVYACTLFVVCKLAALSLFGFGCRVVPIFFSKGKQFRVLFCLYFF